MQTGSSEKFSYFHQLNIVRFILAIGVVIFHFGNSVPPFQSGFLHELVIHSAFRVSFFFFISGFVMTLVYAPQETSPSRFYLKRLSRIGPMYLIAFAITLLLVIFLKGSTPKGMVIILHALMLQSWDPGYVLDLNFPTWSISVEVAFYAAFPFILKWMRSLRISALIAWTLIIWTVQSVQHICFVEWVYDGTKRSEEFISSFPLWHASTFIFGMASALAFNHSILKREKQAGTWWLAVLGLALLVMVAVVPNPIRPYIHNGLLSPIFAMVVAGLYFDRSALSRFLSHPWVSGLGNLSYAIFIFQYSLWLIWESAFGTESRTSPMFFSYLFLLMLLSALVHHYLERPLLHYSRSRLAA